MAIVKPENMDFSNKNIIMIISGLPGVGKTTLALSAPGVVLIDADEGLARVKPEHRKDAAICETYEELLQDIKAFKGTYETVVIDTGGSLIDMLKDWAMRTDPKANRKNGGFSLQGFGIIKTEFLRLSAELRKHFNVVFLFHVSKEKNDEEVFYDLVCEGSAKNLVWQPADLGAYMHIMNGERYLGFTPTANYNAKAAYGIKGLVKVPELAEGQENNFLTKVFETAKKALQAETEALKPLQEQYEQTMAKGKEYIGKIEKPEQALLTLNAIRAMKHALTSQKELEATFKEKVKELGFKYDGKQKTYVAADKEDEK